jgi:hypothetical protein
MRFTLVAIPERSIRICVSERAACLPRHDDLALLPTISPVPSPLRRAGRGETRRRKTRHSLTTDAASVVVTKSPKTLPARERFFPDPQRFHPQIADGGVA